MIDLGYLGSVAILLASIALNGLVLAYRWPRVPGVRRTVDRLAQRVSGRSDWSWLRLGYLLLPIVLLTVANIVWQVGSLHCADDSLAIFASGQAALHGQNPFYISFCSQPPYDIPYGLAAVTLDAIGAAAGTVAGIWIVWQLVALAVVPLVWSVGGKDRRYCSVLAATSVLYLPNIATNIGVDNAIVPVSVLVMLLAFETGVRGKGWLKGLAAFLSTARFPALFPLLGSSGAAGPARWRQFLGVLAVFLGSALLAYGLWGWDAISIVYLGQFSRLSGGTLNFFAVLLQQGWFLPSIASAGIQGGVLLVLVLLVTLRRYSVRPAVAIPLLGVMSLSQYLSFHFVIWIVPLVLLGPVVNLGLWAYGAGAAFDQFVAMQYLGYGLGIWWPYEVVGVALSILLLYLLVRILRDEERRRRSVDPPRPAASGLPVPGGPSER